MNTSLLNNEFIFGFLPLGIGMIAFFIGNRIYFQHLNENQYNRVAENAGCLTIVIFIVLFLFEAVLIQWPLFFWILLISWAAFSIVTLILFKGADEKRKQNKPN